MAKYRKDDEPVPGYRLVQYLGSGGAGEVWKARGPGDVLVAIKMLSIDTERRLADREVKALTLLKNIRNPFLLPIFGMWLRDDEGHILLDADAAAVEATAGKTAPRTQGSPTLVVDLKNYRRRTLELVIAMGLGDKTLLDRLKECPEGEGIPIEELMRYMRDAARGLDFLNSPQHDLGDGQKAAIYHCDIKPENILIVGGGVQICDFGLAKVVNPGRSSATMAGFTPDYVAPEVIVDRLPTATSDQYSLAITYYRLRTGRSPFPDDCGLYEKLDRHRNGQLDFSGLTNPDERRVVQVATHRDPDKRYSSNEEFVRRLDEALDRSKTQPVPPAGPGPGWTPREKAELLGYTLEERVHLGRHTQVWRGRSRDGLVRALLIRDLSAAPNSVSPAALRCIQGLPHERHGELWELKNYAFLDEEGRLIELTGPKSDLPPPHTLILVGRHARQNLEQRLSERMRESGTGIEPGELLPYMRDLARALDTLNNVRLASSVQTPQSSNPLAETVDIERVSAGQRFVRIVHGNLRPANFLLLKDGRVQLGNYAHVQLIEGDAQDFSPSDVSWDPPYSAPEASAGRLTRWSDQYALAMCYVQLRTGRPAVDSSASTQDVARRERLPRLDLSRLPQKAERKVVARALEERPEARWPDCSSFVEALHEAITAPPPDTARRSRMIIAAVLAVLVAVVGWINRDKISDLTTALLGGGHKPDAGTVFRQQVSDLLDRAAQAASDGDWEEADSLLTQAEGKLAQPPGGVRADDLQQRASDLRQQIDAGHGEMHPYDPAAVAQLLRRAGASLKRGDAEAALGQAEQWRERVRDPRVGSLAEYWLVRACALAKLGRWAEVPEALEQATKLGEQYAQDERALALRIVMEFRASAWHMDASARQKLVDLLEPLRRRDPDPLFLEEIRENITSLVRAELDTAWNPADPASRQAALQGVARLPLNLVLNRASIETEAAICRTLADAGEDPRAQLKALATVPPQQWENLNQSTAIAAVCRAVHAAALSVATPEALWQAYDLLRSAAQASPDLAHHEASAVRWELAAAWLRKQAVRTDEPVWQQLREHVETLAQDAEGAALDPARAEALAWSYALLAECQLKLNADPQLVTAWLAKAKSDAGSDPVLGGYVASLDARLDHARGLGPSQLIAAADRLASAYGQESAAPVLGVAYRRRAAEPLLVDAALRKLRLARFADLAEEPPADDLFKQTPLDGPSSRFNTVADARQVAGWFTTISGSTPVPEEWGPEALALHILALFHAAGGEPDETLGTHLAGAVPRLPTQLHGHKLLDRSQWHFILARAYEAKQPRLAVQSYAEAYERASRGVRARDLWEQVVARGLELFESKLKPQAATLPQEVRLAAARLYAAKAELMDRDTSLAQGAEGATPALLKADAYAEAVQLVPENASYRARRGLARLELPGTDLKQIETEDVEPLFAPSRELPYEAYELRGKLRLYQAGRVSVFAAREQKEQLLTEAMGDWAEALRRIQPRSPDYPAFLVRKAYVHLYLANLRDPCHDDYRALVAADLDTAVAAARQAVDIPRRWREHEAFDALGNAIEDYGWLLQEHQRYEEALGVFTQAIEAARREGLAAARSTMNRGRCAYKAVLSALGPPPKKRAAGEAAETEDRWMRMACGLTLADLARAARDDLETAALDATAPPDVQAECALWLARLLPALSPPEFDAAVEQWRAALAHIGTDPHAANWPLFQVEAAEYFLAYAQRLRADDRARSNALLDEARKYAQRVVDVAAEAGIGMPYRLRAVRVLQTVLAIDGRPAEALALYEALTRGLAEQNPAQRQMLVEILCQQARFMLGVAALKVNGRTVATRALDLAANAELPCTQTRALVANTAFDLARELRATATGTTGSPEQKLAYRTALERAAIHFEAALKGSKPEGSASARLLFAQAMLLLREALAISTPPQRMDDKWQARYKTARDLLQEVAVMLETVHLGLGDTVEAAIKDTLKQMDTP